MVFNNKWIKDTNHQHLRKLGCKQNNDEQIEHCSQKASNAFQTKLHIYNLWIKSILYYGSETWILNRNREDKIDIFHRKQLCKLLVIFYPQRISNKKIYKISESSPISIYEKNKTDGECLDMYADCQKIALLENY